VDSYLDFLPRARPSAVARLGGALVFFGILKKMGFAVLLFLFCRGCLPSKSLTIKSESCLLFLRILLSILPLLICPRLNVDHIVLV